MATSSSRAAVPLVGESRSIVSSSVSSSAIGSASSSTATCWGGWAAFLNGEGDALEMSDATIRAPGESSTLVVKQD